MKDFVGAIVRESMDAGDPIRDPKFVMAKGSDFMAAVLPQGMRAVAIDITPESGAGGFILPDDRVDVMLTYHDKAVEKATGVEKVISDTILRNVPVLAVDRDYFENQPYWNLGCAIQRNLAAQVADPADLMQPRGETPAYAMRRTTVVEKYRQGQATATGYPAADTSKISNVGQ